MRPGATVVATHQIELFGHVTYSSDLSYHDLLEREEALKNLIQAVLAQSGADFIHFEALGDALRVQCVFADDGEVFFHRICDGLCPYMAEGLAGRLLFVDKDLHDLYYYSLSAGKWQESTLALPPAGHLEKAEPVAIKAPEPYAGSTRGK